MNDRTFGPYFIPGLLAWALFLIVFGDSFPVWLAAFEGFMRRLFF